MKIQAVQAFFSVAFVVSAGFVGGSIAWLVESVQYDWEVKVGLGAIFIGGLILGISLIIQCFFPTPAVVPSQPYVEKEKFK